MKTRKILFQLTILFLIVIVVIICNSCEKEETSGIYIDNRDGQSYRYVKIGNQYWMTENINYVVSNGCWVYNNDTSNASTYGRLYNWITACNVCPSGWHLPSDDEWFALTDCLGGSSEAGGKLKEEGTAHWNSPNKGATNSVDFSALPGGFRDYDGDFRNLGGCAYFWASTDYYGVDAWYRQLNSGNNRIDRYLSGNRNLGFSVRCVRD